ncbi:PQQ-binding-like beta-propeller repeat protein [Thalassoglobus sp.]|uniref:outer membrane protein assembly factor BamB family protein n=1 Tax=Thalassoglobus sp. TaxID=2795869 RepID=UPI003AA8D9BA
MQKILQHRSGDHRVCIRTVALSITLFSCLIFSTDQAANAADEWTSFQNGGEINFDEQELGFSAEWSVAITGYGQSSPLVWKDQVYITSVSGPNKEHCLVTAFNIATGKELWQYETTNATPQENNNYISKAAPSPVVDERGIICFFEGGNLFSLSHSGEIQWQRNLVEEYGPIDARHGLSASLEQRSEFAFVWVERQTDPYLLAINKKTGENLWKVPGLGVTSWASPRVIPVKGGEHLVLSGIGKLAGFDLQSGKRLWEFDDISGNSTPTPMPVGEGTFLIGATVGRGESESGRAAESNGLISVEQSDAGVWSAAYVWHSKRATSSFSSPICSGDYCYFTNRTGVLYCLDKMTGEEQYAKRVGGSLWATPIVLSQKILLPLKDGKLTTVASGPKFQMFETAELFSEEPSTKPAEKADDAPPGGGNTLYAAVLTGQRVIARSGDRLFSMKIRGDVSK